MLFKTPCLMLLLLLLIPTLGCLALLDCDLQYYFASGYFGQEYGYSVDSLDNIVVVGNPQISVRPITSGDVHIFNRESGQLTQTLKPFGKFDKGPTFGFSVALTSNGVRTLLLVGAPYAGGTPPSLYPSGIIYLFILEDSTGMFVPVREINHHSPNAAQLGHAMVAFEHTVYISAIQALGSGAVYRYSVATDDILIDQLYRFPISTVDIGYEWFGFALAVNNKQLLVNARNYNSTGAVFEFTHDKEQPVYRRMLPTPPNLPQTKLFGSGVSISADGMFSAVGTPRWALGVVHIYEKTHSILYKIAAPASSPGKFGENVRFQNDTTLYVGDLGGVYIYRIGKESSELIASKRLPPGRDDATNFGRDGLVGWPESGQAFRFVGCSEHRQTSPPPTASPSQPTSLGFIVAISVGVLILVCIFVTIGVLWFRKRGEAIQQAANTQIHIGDDVDHDFS